MYTIGWHFHHEAELPLEINSGTLESRLRDIDSIKSISETPDQILRRKQLIKVFEGELPEWLQPADAERRKADAECRKANAEYRKANAECRKANAECQKANAEYRKADAEWQKADAERRKANAECQKAYAEWQKADAERRKANAECRKANAECQKANAEYRKADAEWHKALRAHFPELMELHREQCGCGWTPENRNIFNYKP